MSPTEGTGNATLTFAATANTGSNRTGSFTVSVTGASPARTSTVTAKQGGPATIGDLQVCKTEGNVMIWSCADSYCSDLTAEGKDDWYLPSKDQLLTMYKNMTLLQSCDDFTPFVDSWHWSSTIRGKGHYVLHFGTRQEETGIDTNPWYVRCVRDKESE